MYTLTSPLFDKVAIHKPNGKTFTVTTHHNREFNVDVQRRTLNGQPFEAQTIPHETVTAGGELVADMGPRPNDGGSDRRIVLRLPDVPPGSKPGRSPGLTEGELGVDRPKRVRERSVRPDLADRRVQRAIGRGVVADDDHAVPHVRP